MKSILAAAFIVCTLFPGRSSAADIVTLIPGTTFNGEGQRVSPDLVLAAGDTATVLSKDGITEVKGELSGQTTGWIAGTGPFTVPVIVAGPAVLRVVVTNAHPPSHPGWATIKVERSGVPEVAPNGTVVIPEDATGQFQVVLESSTDLLTWTAVNPGTYGGTTTRRFFRTRIVRQ